MNLIQFEVRASAGEGRPAGDIHPHLSAYVVALNAEEPLYGLKTGVYQLDLTQLLQALSGKVGAADSPHADLVVDRTHHDLHEIDVRNPSLWTPSTTALMYEVQVPDGAGGTEPQYLSICFL